MGLNARQKSLIKAIAGLSLPAIVTNITVPLLGICDIAIAGHRGGAAFIAALAVATGIFNVLIWLFGFLRMGTSGLTALQFGSGNIRGAMLVLYRAMVIALVFGVLLVALRSPLAELMLRLMDVEGETALYARRYFGIVIWAAPAILLNLVMTGWLLGMQNTRIPMIISIVANVANIVISVGLVFGLRWHIEGVATGTLVAHWLSFGLVMWMIFRRFKFEAESWRVVFDRSGFSPLFRVNRDIFLRTLCLAAVTLWFTRIGASQGELMLAVNALIMQLFTIFSYFMDGFAFSAEALVGRFIGAKDKQSLKATIRIELFIGLILATLFMAIYFVSGDLVFSLLTDDLAVVVAVGDYRWWGVTIPLAGFMAFSCDGIFIGATRTDKMLLSVVFATISFFALWWILFPIYGNHGLWFAFLCYLLIRGFILFFSLKKLNMDETEC